MTIKITNIVVTWSILRYLSQLFRKLMRDSKNYLLTGPTSRNVYLCINRNIPSSQNRVQKYKNN